MKKTSSANNVSYTPPLEEVHMYVGRVATLSKRARGYNVVVNAGESKLDNRAV